MPLDTAPAAPKFAPTFAKPRKGHFADGQVIYSSWYEHPYRDTNGRLRASDDAVRRIQQKARNCE